MANAYFGVVLWSVRYKYRSIGYIDELSSMANELLKKYGHYFAMSLGAKDFSASCATFQFGGIALMVFCLIKGFWWSIIFCAINWIVMGYWAVSYSPIAMINKNPNLADVHDEIMHFFYKDKSIQNEDE